MLQYKCDDQGGPQPQPGWTEPKPATPEKENPEQKPEEEKKPA